MNPGDQLFVYTDGVPEAVNQGNEQFGTDRMLEVLNRNKNVRPEEILSRMKSEIDAFVGDVPQFDDTTMLCFQYKGAGN
jgi:sigma-B regulation protein RsbU (phosphoserine phosphatase)